MARDELRTPEGSVFGFEFHAHLYFWTPTENQSKTQTILPPTAYYSTRIFRFSIDTIKIHADYKFKKIKWTAAVVSFDPTLMMIKLYSAYLTPKQSTNTSAGNNELAWQKVLYSP